MSSVFVQRFSLGGSGLSVAVKDSIDVAGYQTRLGSEALETTPVANQHAEVVERILEAGCHLTGKLNMHEFAFGMTGVNNWTGTPVNYLYPDYIPGGSSSGSAVAVAEGAVDFSLGSDTGGSIRVPAACCGVYGFKPTFGRVSRVGAAPANTSLDCVGPFARNMDTLIAAMKVIDPGFKSDVDVGALSLGRVNTDADQQLLSVIEGFISQTGFKVIDVELPSMAAAFKAGLALINAETWAACGQYLETNKVAPDVATRLLAAKNTSASEIAEAEKIREIFTQEVDKALALSPVLFMPTLPSFPMKRDRALAGETDLTISALVRPFNLSGHPALSVPMADSGGRPIGLQLIAAKGQDEWLCEVARVITNNLV